VVLRLIAQIIQQAQEAGKGVSVCGEMAGDVAWTRLLLGMGLRRFSMHPSQILTIKEQVLISNTQELAEWAQVVLQSDDPAQLLQQAAQVS
jgi:phosphotransferase system enzyme I (PtsI)